MQDRGLSVLYVTYGVPFPPTSGAKLRDYHLIRQIARRHSLWLLCLAESREELDKLPYGQQYCRSVDGVVERKRSVWKQFPGMARCALAGRPLETYLAAHEELAAKIQQVVTGQDIDVLQIEHSFMAPYIEQLPARAKCATVLDLPDVRFLNDKRMLRIRVRLSKKLRYLLGWLSGRQWEPSYAARFDRCVVVSPDDLQVLRSANPNLSLRLVENGVDTSAFRPLAESSYGSDLVFVGRMDYAPNADAVLDFCDTVLPLVEREVPDARLIVVGSDPPEPVRRLQERQNVCVTGSVPDVIPYYQQSRVSVVPLRAGGGTRLKILEAMALGRPVVSTSIGCEGLGASQRENIFIADEPQEFAGRVVELLRDGSLRERMCSNARKFVETNYDWSVTTSKLLALYDELAQGVR